MQSACDEADNVAIEFSTVLLSCVFVPQIVACYHTSQPTILPLVATQDSVYIVDSAVVMLSISSARLINICSG